MGHTLGACGALEAWMTAEMMGEGWFTPTLNLHEVDPRCGDIDYLMGSGPCHRHRVRDDEQLCVRWCQYVVDPAARLRLV